MSRLRTTWDLSEVFVPGGQPDVTYVARAELGLETQLRDYLCEGHRVLSVAGPTKSGKTVLVKSVATNALWLTGGNIASVRDFWEAIADLVGAFPTESTEDVFEEIHGHEVGGEASAGLAGVLHGRAKASRSDQEGSAHKRMASRTRRLENMALDALFELGQPIVIDDFHYIAPDVQRDLVRALKQPVFDGLRVIVSAVPHRSFDAVRSEKEMTGRVEHLVVPPWDTTELVDISARGFQTLGAIVGAHDQYGLAVNSFGSPHLMQDFCLQFAKAKRIRSTNSPPLSVSGFSESQWRDFFRMRARSISTSASELLAAAPKPRARRTLYKMKDGALGDLRELLLAAMAKTGPQPEITLKQLQVGARALLAEREQTPSLRVIESTLAEMAQIAQERSGELMLDYDAEYEKLFVCDPFFAFVLRWGDGGHTPKSFVAEQDWFQR